MSQIIFSLDPGSKQTGWAVMAPGEKLLEAGLLLPHRVRDETADRLTAMKEDLIELLNQHQPAAIVIEWTSGKVIRSRHAGGGMGLPIYGVAVGALWQVCEYWAQARTAAGHPCRVVRIPENEWTQGRPKQRRRIGGQPALSRVDIIEHRFPQYVPAQDPGGDVADAIGLNVYYQHRQELLGLADGRPTDGE